jgi:hypothetical protein
MEDNYVKMTTLRIELKLFLALRTPPPPPFRYPLLSSLLSYSLFDLELGTHIVLQGRLRLVLKQSLRVRQISQLIQGKIGRI